MKLLGEGTNLEHDDGSICKAQRARLDGDKSR